MERHGFKAMSDADRQRRTVQPPAKTVSARKRSYEKAVEAVRSSQEARQKQE